MGCNFNVPIMNPDLALVHDQNANNQWHIYSTQRKIVPFPTKDLFFSRQNMQNVGLKKWGRHNM